MVKYHHRLNGNEFEHTLGDSGEQRTFAHRGVGHSKS